MNRTFKGFYGLFIAGVLSLALMAGCGGGGGGGSSGGGNNSITATVPGNLTVASGDNATQYTVFNSNQSSTPSSAGSFSTAVAKDSPTYTYAISNTGNKVYAVVSTAANGSVTIDAQSTAEALVLLNPLLIPSSSIEYANIINIVKSNDAVKSLAATIASVYATVEDPLSDQRIADATAAAVKSVLTSLQSSKTSAKSLSNKAQKNSLAIVHYAASDTPSIEVHSYDMGALTLSNSSGTTLKIELDDSNIGGISTNLVYFETDRIITDGIMREATDGRVWAWGYNGSGQLGDGTKTNRTIHPCPGEWIVVIPFSYAALA